MDHDKGGASFATFVFGCGRGIRITWTCSSSIRRMAIRQADTQTAASQVSAGGSPLLRIEPERSEAHCPFCSQTLHETGCEDDGFAGDTHHATSYARQA